MMDLRNRTIPVKRDDDTETTTMDSEHHQQQQQTTTTPTKDNKRERSRFGRSNVRHHFRIFLGWLVHFYTATGVLVNFYSLIHAFILESNFHLFARLNWLAIFIDATDGTLARAIDIKKTIPQYDGALLDNIIDFITFSFLPSLSIVTFNIIPSPWSHLCSSLILISSAYAFCQTLAKTTQAFVGFPSYWNIVVFYLYYLDVQYEISVIVVIICSILSFVPVHFIYPTRTKRFHGITLTGAYIWGGLMLFVSVFPKHEYVHQVLYVSLIYVAYYIIMSFYLDSLRRQKSVVE